MANPQEALIARIHAANRPAVLAVTGGGSGGIAQLLAVPGASRTVLSAVVPYAAEALSQWLGVRPEEFCSDWTARAMAMRAYDQARHLAPTSDVVGVACTASLASDRPKRGPHRVHLAFQTRSTTATAFLELDKGARGRAEEEQIVAALLVDLVAQACEIADRPAIVLRASEKVMSQRIDAPPEQQELLAGIRQLVAMRAAASASPKIVFPGAFHPLHDGHRRMAQVASEILGHPTAYEIAILNVDKPPLDFIEMDLRARQFAADEALYFTRAGVFSAKADLFPGASFIVGADTIERIGQPRYYGDSAQAMEAAFAHIGQRGCGFLVFGRVVEGQFHSLSALQIPPSLRALCREVPEAAFRQDISSTELRQAARAN